MKSRSTAPSVRKTDVNTNILSQKVESQLSDSSVRDTDATTHFSINSESFSEAFITEANNIILRENVRVLQHLNPSTIGQFIANLVKVKRIFVVGEGRSGLVSKMAAIRLMHLGYQVYVVGETVTPAIMKDDLLIACSGSGGTQTVCVMAEKAKAVGAQLAVITTAIHSPLASLADMVIELAAATKHDKGSHLSQQFAGSLFEQSMLLLFDSIFHILAKVQGKDATTLWALHTNLE